MFRKKCGAGLGNMKLVYIERSLLLKGGVAVKHGSG